MQAVNYAVICAAGMGTRLGLNKCKCLVEIHGHPVIYYLLDLVKDIKNVRIVVGFMEDEVIRYVRSVRNDVVFVRNPDFKTTSNAYSLWLGSRDITEGYITIDGDMLIQKSSWIHFLKRCSGNMTVVGVASSKTEDPVYVDMEDGKVVGFSREQQSPYEWCGIGYFCGIDLSDCGERYVYQLLEPSLPHDYQVISCFEIDTPPDLSYAAKNFKPDI